MQIVIDIPEDVYTRLFDNGRNYVMDMRRACAAIRKGTILPKHGRLIDESKITKCEQIGLVIKDDKVTRCLRTNAPTIIEADGGDEE